MKKIYSKTSFCITGIKTQTYRWIAIVEFENGHTFSTRSADIDIVNPFLEAFDEKKVDACITRHVESLSKAAWDLLSKHSKSSHNFINVVVADKISVELEYDGSFNCIDFEGIPEYDANALRYLLKKIKTLK